MLDKQFVMLSTLQKAQHELSTEYNADLDIF